MFEPSQDGQRKDADVQVDQFADTLEMNDSRSTQPEETSVANDNDSQQQENYTVHNYGGFDPKERHGFGR